MARGLADLGRDFPNVAARPEMFDFPFRIGKSRLSDAPKLSDPMNRARGLDGRESEVSCALAERIRRSTSGLVPHSRTARRTAEVSR
jgi:hypothetical protein